ncbi:hypothetical protein CK203_047992 [Vitis vinifera]|uniref:Uncharacterized protein n=1 Tax=Vitis vinifera TaxID=29760 RepID=A0A438GH55_VITVI|nr:hypothetical protein CK203_047992 [Vitis vinifera]
MGDLKDEDHPIEATTYVVAAATMKNKNKKDYSIPPSIEVKGQNETCAINNTKFSKSGTKGKDIGLDFNSLDDKFEIVMEDKKDENHDHIDVKTNTEEITYIVVAENI